MQKEEHKQACLGVALNLASNLPGELVIVSDKILLIKSQKKDVGEILKEYKSLILDFIDKSQALSKKQE